MAYTTFQGMNGHSLPCAGKSGESFEPTFSDLAEYSSADWLAHDESLHALIGAIPARVAILDMYGRVVAANHSFHELVDRNFRQPADGMLGRDYAYLVLDRMETCPHTIRLVHGISSILAGAAGPCRSRLWMDVAGESREFAIVASPFSFRNARHVMVCHYDISDISDFKDSPENDAQLQIIAKQQERRRIGQELHDTTAQQLVVLSLLLHRIGGVNGNEEVGGLIAEAKQTIDDALKDLRSFSYMLHPPQEGWPGLHEALARIVRGLSDRTGVHISFEADSIGHEMQTGIELAVYRIAQEALTNVYRHSGASNAEVRIFQNASELALSILDDGHGFDMTRMAPGVGLASMRERAEALGGVLEITSDGKGTLIAVHIPLKPAARTTPLMQHEIMHRVEPVGLKMPAPNVPVTLLARPALR